MERLIIKGGKPLQGRVNISGAKNSILPLMAASLLAEGIHQFTNVPRLRDVFTMQKLLKHFGIPSQIEENTLTLTTHNLTPTEAPYDLVKTMRASVLVLGPLLGRFGKAKVSLPGGCAIGARPIDLHLEGFKKLGAQIEIEGGYVVARAKKLVGAEIHFKTVTVTGTENLMMAASLAQGTTVLKNCAREPEVPDLAQYLNKMGGRIEGAGTDTITIEGVTDLKAAGHRAIADRIEAATFLIAGAITGGAVSVVNCPASFLSAPLRHLQECGCTVQINEKNGKPEITLSVPNGLKATDIITAPFPGLATDLQAQFMALLSLAEGTSVITETIFENRFQHALELKRLGADIELQGNQAVVKGVQKLSGAPLMATDLRASASLILAGLAAEGTTQVDRAYHIDRGYERIEEKLKNLGANISRES